MLSILEFSLNLVKEWLWHAIYFNKWYGKNAVLWEFRKEWALGRRIPGAINDDE